jgi:hypothetical protein
VILPSVNKENIVPGARKETTEIGANAPGAQDHDSQPNTGVAVIEKT